MFHKGNKYLEGAAPNLYRNARPFQALLGNEQVEGAKRNRILNESLLVHLKEAKLKRTAHQANALS